MKSRPSRVTAWSSTWKSRSSAPPTAAAYPFEISEFRKYCLLNGFDDIGLTLRKADTIRAYEEKHLHEQPWLSNTI
jgi:3-isopropylmalate/(R)-2-methylmalate dehydratase small subunit